MDRLRNRNQYGFSLVELMIAVAVFSTGLGGLSLLLLLSVQETTSAGLQSIAVSQARSMSEFLQLLPGAARENITPSGSPACLDGGSCSAEQMAGAAVSRWQIQIEDRIPGGTGTVCRDSTPDDGGPEDPACDGAGPDAVKVFWTEQGRQDGPVELERRIVVPMPLP